ncbi:hypothetical protein ACFQYP_54405 [Nonomuraea antimicrobica]
MAGTIDGPALSACAPCTRRCSASSSYGSFGASGPCQPNVPGPYG